MKILKDSITQKGHSVRIIIATIIALFVSSTIFLSVTFWGQSQHYAYYEHPLLPKKDASEQKPIIILALSPELLKKYPTKYAAAEAVMINLSITGDNQWVVTPLEETFRIQNKKYEQISDQVLKLEDLIKDSSLKILNKKMILNIVENPIGLENSFDKLLEMIGQKDGKSIIVTSPYEVPLKTLKEKYPTFIFGSSKPEVLKLKAMESLYLIGAATLRADMVIYPLTYYKQPFYTETLLKELKHRYKNFIVGPLEEGELPKALELKPWGVIEIPKDEAKTN